VSKRVTSGGQLRCSRPAIFAPSRQELRLLLIRAKRLNIKINNNLAHTALTCFGMVIKLLSEKQAFGEWRVWKNQIQER
jgi:hypothetical protein